MSMRHRTAASLLALLALTLGLGACSRADDAATPRTAARTPSVPATPTPAPDANGPARPQVDAAAPPSRTASAEGTNSAETAKGSDPPMSTMDKETESKAMPQPGQANDHSTLAQDPKQPK